MRSKAATTQIGVHNFTPIDKTQLVAHFFDNTTNTNSLAHTIHSTLNHIQRGRSALRNTTFRTPGIGDNYGGAASTLATT